jgi:hypothetical protein
MLPSISRNLEGNGYTWSELRGINNAPGSWLPQARHGANSVGIGTGIFLDQGLVGKGRRNLNEELNLNW